MKKILLPTDFSKASERAIHYTLALLDDTDCEFTLLNTYTTNFEPEIAMYVLDDLKMNSEKLMAGFLKSLQHYDNASQHVFKTEYMPVSAGTAIQILNQTNQYDLVVLGASGSGLNLLFGSVATDVVRNVKVNTLIIPNNMPIRPLKSVVLAVDYNEVRDLKVFDNLKDLLAQKDVQFTLLTVLNDNQSADEIDGLAKYKYHIYFEDIKVNDFYIKNDDVEIGIKEFLEIHRADMLVMVSRHHSLLDVLFNRSITRKFAYHPSVPLLCIYD
jgi:nucleotide-binding universal stress UspA family protein